MNLREYRTPFFVGVASSVLWLFVLKNLNLFGRGELVGVAIAIPVLFVLAAFLAVRFFHGHIFHKLLKFLIVGVLNTGIDFFIFNTLIALTAIETGAFITVFKSISFVCALFNSYELNRLWTFDGEASDGRSKQEFMRFAAITIIGFLINVGITSLIIATIRPAFGFSQVRWDNVAAAAATGLNLLWNFAGYKAFVFKSKGRASDLTSPNVI